MRVNRHEGKVAKVGASSRHLGLTVDLLECVRDLNQVRLPRFRERIVAFTGPLP